MKYPSSLFNRFGISLMTAIVWPAFAAPPVEPDLFSLPLEALLTIEVKSSTLTSKNRRTAPAAVTVFSREQIQALPVTYLHELINYVPGFQSYRQGEAGDEYYHSARGRRTGASSREVLVLLNGMRLNREADNALAIPGILLDSIEHIEFIRGPGSALYGSNAFLGIINITSSQSAQEVSVRAGSHALTHGHALVRAQAGQWQFNGYAALETEDGHHLEGADSFDRGTYNTRDAAEKSDFQASMRYKKTQFEAAYFRRESDGYYVLENSADINGTENTFAYLRLRQGFQASTQWSGYLQATLSEAEYMASSHLAPDGFARDYGGSAPESEAALLAVSEQEEAARSLFWHNDWQASPRQSFQGGAEYRHVRQPATIIYTNFNLDTLPIEYLGDAQHPTTISPPIRFEVFGVYAQSQTRLSDSLELTLGLRYDDYSYTDDELSSRAALTWQLNERHTLKMLYGEAFRAPTTNERAVGNNTVLVSTPNLKPEQIRTAELNWLGQWQRLNLELAWHYSAIDNAIQQTFNNQTRVFINNSEQQEIAGLEAEVTCQLFAHWQLVVTASTLSTLPQSQFRQADTLASLQLLYSGRSWNGSLTATYAGEREMQVAQARLKLDDYALLNGKVGYQLLAHHRISATVKNLLDEDYQTPTQGQTLATGLPNRGREFLLEYQFRF